MPIVPDPYRILGLARGATLAEVKRAYRRLAKANHPDAAGPAAISRFLAIQAAYDQLTGPSARAGPAGRAAPTNRQQSSAADPDRTEATRRAYRARPAEGPADAGHGAKARPGRTRAARPDGTRGTDPDLSNGDEPRARADRGKATLGSTSYDGADAGPFEPDWGGASWYGTTSGTYWTINPREYADPRKHGPEYQARARRRPPSVDGRGEPATTSGEAATGSAASDAAADPADESVAAAAPSAGPGPSQHEAAGEAASRTASSGRRPRYATRPPAWAPGPPQPPDAGRSWSVMRFVDGARRTVSGRIGLALAGWLPIGIGLAVALGESTGCSRFVEGCEGPFGLATVIGQGSVVVLLLLLPRVAAIATLGTIAMFAAALPTVAALSIASGTRDPAGAAPAFGLILALGWAIGIAVGIGRTLPRFANGRRPPVP
jgi:curved DNA-binding protein CbpA